MSVGGEGATARRVESRRPPQNALGRRGGVADGIRAGVQLVLDLQVATVRRDVREWLKGQGGELLEVGCGDQPYRALVPAACRYTGIDTVDAGQDFGMERRDSIIRYEGNRFPCAEATFNAVFHTEVLEHVYDTAEFLGECRRVLVAGGRLMFTVPFQARYHFIPYDYFRFTPAALEKLLAAAGFEDVVVKPRGTDITVAAYKLAAVPFRWAFGGLFQKLLFVLSAPLLVAALAVAHLSIVARLGSADDCLGYTVCARAA